MQTLEVTFQKNFHTSNEDRFLMETLIIKVSGEAPGETEQVLWDMARKEVEINHRRNNPHLFPPDIPDKEPEYKLAMYQPHEIKRDEKYIYGTTLEEQINSCKDLKNLESYKFIVKGKKDLEEIYNQKLKQLSHE